MISSPCRPPSSPTAIPLPCFQPWSATPAALPADVVSTSQLIAELLDVHGNKVTDDSTTAISFSVSGGPGEILVPTFSLTADGRANALLQSTGSTGKILVFAGASTLAPATFEIPMHQAQLPLFSQELPPLNPVEDGPTVCLNPSGLATDGDSDSADLRFAVATDSTQVRLEIEGNELAATPPAENYWGNLQAALTVRDPTGLESNTLLPIAVQPHNDPPLIVSEPDSVVTADSLFIYQLTAVDPDADRLSLQSTRRSTAWPSIELCTGRHGGTLRQACTPLFSRSATARSPPTSVCRFTSP